MGVLLISSGLIVGLLQEARAITVEFSSPAASITGETAFTFDITIPDGSRVPIISITAIVEKDRAGFSDKSGAVVVSRAICTMITMASSGNCPGSGAFDLREGTIPTAVTKIEFVNAYQNSVSDSYVLTDVTTFFGYDAFDGVTTGYGYDDVSDQFTEGFGYGYGYDTGTGQVAFSDPTGGDGYGYNGDDLVLRFRITVSLEVGTYYLTAIGVTESTIIGDLSSPFHTFTVTSGGGGGGGTTGTTSASPTSTTGTGAGQTQTVTTSATTPPAGATAAFVSTPFTASSGNTVVLTTASENFPTITLVMDGAVTNVQATITVWPAATPPTGFSTPSGMNMAYFLQITIGSGTDSVSTAKIRVKIPAALVTDASKAVILHSVNGVWQPENKIALTQVGGFWEGDAQTTCCSTFAIGFDMANPTVTLTVPPGTLTGTVTFTATASDNLRVTKVELYVDNVMVGSADTSAPYEATFNTATIANGQHTVKAIAYDFVDNKAQQESSITTQNDQVVTSTPTQTTSTTGAPPKGGISPWVWVILALIVLGLIVAAFVLAGKKPPAKGAGGAGATGGQAKPPAGKPPAK